MTIQSIQDYRAIMRRPNRLGAATWMVGLKVTTLCALLILVHPGLMARGQLLVEQGRLGTLAIFGAIWMLAAVATLVAAFEGRGVVRMGWAALLALAATTAWVFHTLSGAEFTVFDAVALWHARHEAGRALANMSEVLPFAGLVFALLFVALAMPVRRMLPTSGWFWSATPLIPILPILAIAGVVFIKAGNGSQAMPKHFSQISLGLLLAYKTAFQPAGDHGLPAWAPSRGDSKDKILFIVDESIRPDYLDPLNAGGETPNFAAVARNWVNFGNAAAGGVCSNYANAILRFAASREDIGRGINSNPTLFAYAKKAGYRTVYIDAQAHTLANTDRLQNFMTRTERDDIDGFYPLSDSEPVDVDRHLADIVRRELAENDRVFIYANKLGAHFPYDSTYPASEAHYHPTIGEAGKKTIESNLASYRNAVRWSVDGYFAYQFRGLDLSNVSLVYTSDHGQYLNPEAMSHCVSGGATAQMALVPIYAFSSDAAEAFRLREGARASRGKASHFQIAPTMLQWMGYPEGEVLAHYGESLAAGTPFQPAFTIGDIFGLFSDQAQWLSPDLTRDYRSTDGNIEESRVQGAITELTH